MTEVCYYTEGEIERLHEELEKHDLKTAYKPDDDCLQFDVEFKELVSKLDVELFGEEPPYGLNTSWPGRNEKLVALLEEGGIPYRKYVRHGKEFYAWSYTDHEKVVKLLNISEERDAYMRTMQDKSFSVRK